MSDLQTYIEKMKLNDNYIWTLGMGNMQNIVDEAVEKIGQLETELAEARKQIEELKKLQWWMEDGKNILDLKQEKVVKLETELSNAKALIDGVYEIIFIYKPQSPSQEIWKQNWLEKAKKHGAGLE